MMLVPNNGDVVTIYEVAPFQESTYWQYWIGASIKVHLARAGALGTREEGWVCLCSFGNPLVWCRVERRIYDRAAEFNSQFSNRPQSAQPALRYR